jgi:uncharacterized protein
MPAVAVSTSGVRVIEIRNATELDFESILKLNDSEAMHTSPMSLPQLKSLAEISAHFKVAAEDRQIVAFILAVREGASYKNDNYIWFAKRFQRFLYVDRVVVSADFTGRKIGSRLYDDLFAFARANAIQTIACEYNIDPPNHGSRVFHDKFGFRELGTHWVAGGTKQVSLQAAET